MPRCLLALACLAALLVGCGATTDPAADNYGWGWHYDVQGPTGLRLRYETPLPTGLTLPDALAWFEAHYRSVEACTGIEAPGPLVVVADVTTVEGDYGGYTYFETGLIVLGRVPKSSLVRHEYVHYLLLYTHLPHYENAAHASSFFDACD